MNKTQSRINIKGALQIIPEDEKVNALDELIAKHKKGGRGSFFFKAILVLNIFMTALLAYLLAQGNATWTILLGIGAVPMWIQTFIHLFATRKNGGFNAWLDAANEVREELLAQKS
ncbi:hypothetical protein [Marinobacter halotolerans]|uniref:hypothetical protein n=1 Tax=Marinobacter halotolerans TaxID=1569211 RepID=UPI001244750D|nr:hypothetical protein [Marinobacter halotolerans]